MKILDGVRYSMVALQPCPSVVEQQICGSVPSELHLNLAYAKLRIFVICCPK